MSKPVRLHECAVHRIDSRVPSAGEERRSVARFSNELLGRLLRSLCRRVEAPGDALQLLHVGFEVLVSVEVESLVGCAHLISVSTDRDAGREHDESYGSRRHQGEE